MKRRQPEMLLIIRRVNKLTQPPNRALHLTAFGCA